MNASWIVASVLTSSLLAGATMAWERVVSLRRGVPLRWAWVAAMIVATGYSAAWLLPTGVAENARQLTSTADRSGAPAPPANGEIANVAPGAVAGSPSILASTSRLRELLSIREIPVRVERFVRIAWVALSSALLAALAWSSVRLRSDRRSWRAAEVQNAPVLISDGFGPAIVGVLRPTIVIPPWVLALEDTAQQTILAHEEEHRRAGDPRLLLAGLGLLVLMPWNIGLWMMWRRLGRAIELDCDERVLARGVRDADYANVLLGAWQRAHADTTWAPSPAFAERASGLGRRVEHLMRPVPRRWRMQAVTGLFVSALLVGAVLLVPSPQLAQGVAAAKHASDTRPLPLVLIDGAKRKDLSTNAANLEEAKRMRARGERIGLMQELDSSNAVRLYGADGVRGAVAFWTRSYMERGGAVLPASAVIAGAAPGRDPTTTDAEMEVRIFTHLFRGITLSSASEAAARALIARDQNAQRALKGPYLAIWPKRIALTTRRNEQLRALLTTPRDLALFEAHAEEAMPSRVRTVAEVARSVSGNYLLRIDVSASDLERVEKVIQSSLKAELELYNRAPTDTMGRQAILAKRDADVRAALSSDATRAAFDKRQAQLRAIKE
ncbi:MAG: M56 family metallopeptidase [Gemmatimonadetes bacterium]|nr:M56 family metallopeptidase [Gemmatimonadota bacterium]